MAGGSELADGKAGYLSTRLKVVTGGRIVDVEISADTSHRVASSCVWNLDPSFTAVLPEHQRVSRVALEALARRYFHSLSTHQTSPADFDGSCNRYHSGQQITNVASNTRGDRHGQARAPLRGTRPGGPPPTSDFR